MISIIHYIMMFTYPVQFSAHQQINQSVFLYQACKQNLIVYDPRIRSKLLSLFCTEVVLLRGSRNQSKREQTSRLQKFKLIFSFGRFLKWTKQEPIISARKMGLNREAEFRNLATSNLRAL